MPRLKGTAAVRALADFCGEDGDELVAELREQARRRLAAASPRLGWWRRATAKPRRAMLRLLHRRCEHRSENVVADILAGDGHRPIMWCRDCGAIDRFGHWELAVDPFAKGR